MNKLLLIDKLSSATNRVEEPAKAVTLVEQVQHDTEWKHLAEEHAGVTATGVVGTLHQPHHVPEHIQHKLPAKLHFKIFYNNKDPTIQ